MIWRLFQALALFVSLSAALAQTTAAPGPELSPAIRTVSFEHVSALSAESRQKIIQLLRNEDPAWVARQSPDEISNFIKNMVLSMYQDLGYWRARVSAKVTWVRGKGEQRQVDALISAVEEGEAYRVKEIRWLGVTVFSPQELQNDMPFTAGDRMSRASVEAGLEKLRERYATRGYLAFTAIPQAQLDDTAHSVSLQITVQEDSPFHFGSLSTDGLDAQTSRQLRQAWARLRDQLYSADKLRSLLSETLLLPAGADPLDYSIRNMDFDTHTINVVVSVPPATRADKER
jgi:outer membrane protein assembly factor BamA